MLLTASLVCLTQAVFFEARGEPLEGQEYVATVVKNRVVDKRFPGTYCGVVEQHKQFSYTEGLSRDRLMDLTMEEPEAWEKSLNVAIGIMNSGENLENVLYFHGKQVTPRWDYSKIEKVKNVGNHVFYKD